MRRAPAWVAPYHPRLDWQMWFAPFGGPGANPFPAAPPRYVRASLYAYRFTDIPTRLATGAWWQRRFVAPYIAPMSSAGP